MMDPQTELPSFLIKPVQRICKYPLLLRELLKSTDAKDEQKLEELEHAYECMNRVVAIVNELQRKAENSKIVDALEQNVEDWKGFNVREFGSLLLDKVIFMARHDTEKEVHMFLFERIMICCKQNKKEKKKSLTFMRSSRKSSNGSIHSQSGVGRINNYQLRGGISMSQIEGCVASNKNSVLELKIFFKDHETNEMESFTLKFLNEEDLKRWQSTIENLLLRYKRHSLPANTNKEHRVTALTTSASSGPRRHTQTLSEKHVDLRLNTAQSLLRSSGLDSAIPSPVAESEREASTQQQQPRRSIISRKSAYDRPTPDTSVEKPRAAPKEDMLSKLDQALEDLQELGAIMLDDSGKTLQDPSHNRADLITPARPAQRVGAGAVHQMPTPSQTPQSASPIPEPFIKIKAHFEDDIFVLFVNSKTTYNALSEMITNKITQAGSDFRISKLRYQDEDGDYITLKSDDDVAVAMKLALAGDQTRRVLNLVVC